MILGDFLWRFNVTSILILTRKFLTNPRIKISLDCGSSKREIMESERNHFLYKNWNQNVKMIGNRSGLWFWLNVRREFKWDQSPMNSVPLFVVSIHRARGCDVLNCSAIFEYIRFAMSFFLHVTLVNLFWIPLWTVSQYVDLSYW